LCSKENIEHLESIIFKNTTSIGIRKYKAERSILNREFIDVTTKYGTAKVKVCSYKQEKFYYPEYEDVKKICDKLNLSFKIVVDEIKSSI
jgi:hypothetical protein